MAKLSAHLSRQRPAGPLFLNTRGQPWTRNAIRIHFRNLRKKYPNLQGITAYCYRHTFTTDGLVNGVTLAQMQELLGHSSPQMISAHYGHLSQQAEQMRLAAAKATRPPHPPA
jgi:integrase